MTLGSPRVGDMDFAQAFYKYVDLGILKDDGRFLDSYRLTLYYSLIQISYKRDGYEYSFHDGGGWLQGSLEYIETTILQFISLCV